MICFAFAPSLFCTTKYVPFGTPVNLTLLLSQDTSAEPKLSVLYRNVNAPLPSVSCNVKSPSDDAAGAADAKRTDDRFNSKAGNSPPKPST